MCTVRTKSVAVQKDSDTKAVPVLRNPLLDGVDAAVRSRSTGTRALRIDRGSGASINRPRNPTTPDAPVAPGSPLDAERAKWTAASKWPGLLGRVAQAKLVKLDNQ